MNISTPGVYVQELNTLPPSVAGVSTAIPAFVGYTETGFDTAPKAQRIISMLEYEQHFGGAFNTVTHNVTMTTEPGGTDFTVIDSVSTNAQLYMYDSLSKYFQNGGGPCYIVSVGSYDDADAATATGIQTALVGGIGVLAQVDEVTLLAAPDAMIRKNGEPVLSDNGDDALLGTVMDAAIAQCNALKDRFCIFDVLRGTEEPGPGVTIPDTNNNTDGFRSQAQATNYGAAYYPWLRSSTASPLRYSQLDFGGTPPTDNADDVIKNVDDAFDVMDDICKSLKPAFVRASPKGAVDDLRNIFSGLMSEVLDNGSNARLRRLMLFVVTVASSVAKAENKNAVAGTLAGLRNDLKLREAIVAAAGLANFLQTKSTTSPSTIPVSTTLITNDITGDYAQLNGKKWIEVGPGSLYATTADIAAPDYISSFNPDNQESLTDQRKAAALHLQSGTEVDLNKLFSAYAAIFEAAAHDYNIAESRLFEQHPVFASLKEQLEEESRMVPSQGAVAGVYAATDRNRGVWKAPANVFLSGVSGPAVRISNADQDSLNVDPDTGKSINAIRVFSGQGTVVWGARTLLGNDNEWRYVNVRRFFIFAEESIQKASGAFVFEPNNANTWIKVKTMIMNFLINQWRAGALLGDKAEDAFYVNVGLGETMTPQDVLEGKMIVEVGMAAVRPAEFIILRFTHSMP